MVGALQMQLLGVEGIDSLCRVGGGVDKGQQKGNGRVWRNCRMELLRGTPRCLHYYRPEEVESVNTHNKYITRFDGPCNKFTRIVKGYWVVIGILGYGVIQTCSINFIRSSS